MVVGLHLHTEDPVPECCAECHHAQQNEGFGPGNTPPKPATREPHQNSVKAAT
jgi:hypothetical protein